MHPIKKLGLFLAIVFLGCRGNSDFDILNAKEIVTVCQDRYHDTLQIKSSEILEITSDSVVKFSETALDPFKERPWLGTSKCKIYLISSKNDSQSIRVASGLVSGYMDGKGPIILERDLSDGNNEFKIIGNDKPFK